MSAKNINMTDGGKLFKNLCFYVAPLMLTGILQLLFTASDLIVCGIFSSEDSTGAISSTNSLINLIVNLFMGLSVGANVLMSRAYGANDKEKGQKVVYTAMILALGIGLFLAAFGSGLSRFFLQWMDTDPELIGKSTQYLTVYFLGVPFLMIYNFGASILRAVGDTRRPFYFLTISGVVNVCLNLLFVIVFKLDVLGVAICTDISEALSATLVVIYVCKHKGFFNFKFREMRFYKREAAEIIKIGMPAGIQSSLFSISNILLQASVNSLGSKAIINGNGAASSIEGFIYTSMNSVSQGCVSFASANYGAKNKRNIGKAVIYSVILIMIINLTLGLTAFFLRRHLVSLYVSSPEAIAAGAERLQIILLTYFLCGLMEVPAYAQRAMGYSTLPMLVSIVGVVGMRFVWIFGIFPLKSMHSLSGLMWSYPLSWFLTGAVQYACFFIIYRRLKFMQYRELGSTGLKVSEIGLGCEGFNEDGGKRTAPIIDLAHKNGVNYIDLYTSSPVVRSSLGEALKGRRKDFILQAHICTVWRDGQYKRTRDPAEVEEGFSDLLTRLKTDYIDVGMIHYVDSVAEWDRVADGAVMQYAQKLKSEGKIKHIGLSSHNPLAAQKAVESGLIDVLMFSINPCYDLQPAGENCEDLWAESSYTHALVNMDPDREKLYETCQRLGVGITVMKVFGGGDLLNEELSPAGKALTVSQCIHYALTRPAVATVLVGSHSCEELQTSLDYERATAEERDYAAALASFPKISWQGHCMYCGHCAPCAKNIDIATVTKFLNLARAQGEVPETVREHYAALAVKAGECVECGACEKRCPFGVSVRENMREAKSVFGK